MRNCLNYYILMLFALSTFSLSAQKRVIILGLDGISVEGYAKAKHPNLDKLFSRGMISTHTRTVMPSVTLPNWTSHLTASQPEYHGVDGNGWTIKKHKLSPIETDADGYYPSIFKVLKDKYPNAKTAFYYNWGNLINPINKRYLDEVSFEKDDKYIDNYNKAIDFAVKHRKEPTLIFLYSVHTDHAGHKYKWMSSEYINSIEEGDVYIGELLDKLKAKQMLEETYFLLITDHGGINNGHGGVSLREMEVPWAVVGPKINTGKITSPTSNANTAAVIAKIFKCKSLPKSWIGQVPKEIFK